MVGVGKQWGCLMSVCVSSCSLRARRCLAPEGENVLLCSCSALVSSGKMFAHLFPNILILSFQERKHVALKHPNMPSGSDSKSKPAALEDGSSEHSEEEALRPRLPPHPPVLSEGGGALTREHGAAGFCGGHARSLATPGTEAAPTLSLQDHRTSQPAAPPGV